MPSIYSYRKFITKEITRELRFPEGERHERIGTELATIDGLTYVSLPDGVSLPTDQPPEISDTIQSVTLDPVLRESIKQASPHCQLIAERMIEKIRASYPIDEEMYFARIGVGASLGMYQPSPAEMNELTVFGEFVEGVREWGRSERAKLGL